MTGASSRTATRRHEHSSRVLARLVQPAVTRDDLVAALLRSEDHDFVVGRLGLVGGCDRVPAVERPDRNALERELRVLGEPFAERLPIAGTNALVVHHHVVVSANNAPSDQAP